MTLAGFVVIGIMGLVAVILAGSLATVLVNQRMQIEAMHRDNQSLMEALAKANGQELQFKEPEPSRGTVNYATLTTTSPAITSNIPYWQPKQERTVQIGEKTVTLKS